LAMPQIRSYPKIAFTKESSERSAMTVVKHTLALRRKRV
jgi:hypothetical protein